jgi:2-polyprenyl-3-methyl-5-hydroxy-6-metoxy-1,4-benzoquinol methylase
MRRRTFDRNLAEIERLTEKGTLVDIGCGEGYLLESARDRGWARRYGVDVSAAAVERSAPFGDVQQGTVTEAKLPAGTADVVTAFDSFEHVWDPRAEAAAIFKLLKPGGIAYIVTPDAQSFIARVMGGRWFQFKPDEHVRLYSHASLRQVLREVGFEDPAFHSTGKFSSPSYVATILSTTNPTLGRLLRIALGWTPVWRRLWWIPSGDMCAIARRPAAVSG